MSDEITPARLRELAQDLDRYYSGYTRQFCDALRAAADWREDLESEVSGDIEATRDQMLSAVDAGANQADIKRLNRAVWKLFDRAHALRLMFRRVDRLTATLAAREALLKRADVFLGLAWRYADGGWYEGQSQDKQNIEALAAEIAAALGKETEQ